MKEQAKDPAAVSLGRKGGKNSRAYMSEQEAAELARKAVNERWRRYREAKQSRKPPEQKKP
jgi:hypothetical protein